MELEQSQDDDIYGLILKLCNSIYYNNCSHLENEQQFLTQEDNNKHLRRLKAKAYEILLNKSCQDYSMYLNILTND